MLEGEDEESPEDIEFKSPVEFGIDDNVQAEETFMVDSGRKKEINVCPVCGSKMSYKENVDSYYCPKCRTFY